MSSRHDGHSRMPQCRLADPGRSLQEQGRGSLRHRPDEGLHQGELTLPPEDPATRLFHRLHHPPARRSDGRGPKVARATTVEPDGRCSMIAVVAADGVIRERVPDETLLVFLSDTHIGGSSGGDIFDSAAELTMLLEDLHHHEGPVELVLAGDFVDVLRMADV